MLKKVMLVDWNFFFIFSNIFFSIAVCINWLYCIHTYQLDTDTAEWFKVSSLLMFLWLNPYNYCLDLKINM